MTTLQTLKANHKDNWALVQPKSTSQKVPYEQIDISQLVAENRKLNYLYGLKISLEDWTNRREAENKQSQHQINLAEQKCNRVEGKLDKVRGLVIEGQIERLKWLIKQGEI